MSKSECVFFNGVKFRRYPESDGVALRNYFRPNKGDYRKGVSLLHREVWKHHYGEIPKGMNVHHKDENPLNNDISNLELLTISAHRRQHPFKDPDKQAAHLSRIRGLASEWHGTSEGSEVHSRASKRGWEDRKKKPKKEGVCSECSSVFYSFNPTAVVCGRACYDVRMARLSIGYEERKCQCGKSFQIQSWKKKRFCGRPCFFKFTVHWRHRTQLDNQHH
jgi:hypothetical protein